MKHCMVDLETFGTQAGSVIRSIGAVVFDPRTGIGEEFYRNITEEDQIILGATKDEDTIKWWDKQSQEARDAFADDQVRLEVAALDFAQFWRRNKLTFVWAQGSNFDCVLWEASCKFVNVKHPWQFYNTRDTRTVYDASGFNTKSIKRQGVYHNALADAIHQVRCVYKSYLLIDGVTKR